MNDIDRSARPKVFPTESSVQPQVAMSYTEAELAQARAELAQARAELKDLRGANREYGRQLAAMKENREFWFEVCHTVRIDRDKIQRQLADRTASRDFWHKKALNAESKRDELRQAMQNQSDEALTIVQRLQRELHDAKVQRDEWEKMYCQAIAGTEVERLQAELKQMRFQLSQLAGAEGAFMGSAARAQRAEREQDKAVAEVKRLQTELTQAREEHDQLDDRIEDAMGQIGRYDKHLAENHIQYAVEDVLERLVKAEQLVGSEHRLRQEAELAAHVHDKSCGELAQTVRTERALRLEAEQNIVEMKIALNKALDATKTPGAWPEGKIMTITERIFWLNSKLQFTEAELSNGHKALNECKIYSVYEDGELASARTRIFWLNQRAERAEALAALVTPDWRRCWSGWQPGQKLMTTGATAT